MVDQDPLRWIKASRSYAHGECVELARDREIIRLRDSKNPDVHLHFPRAEVAAFIDRAQRGELDDLLG
ncbi:DUF397 domain-containing protein [Pseudonocardia cypriaca]|uniref:Uncharacterized protein DUF397 n=1 Tax=Pseudonocardia cypriaca TaxID=882449 RepID=A0A543FVU1_9PSEU|nr:DUF397 domain-containing protein [Pseudonocardia cypriaca]TQM37941.1 uncharacterized protein DUF397 [Pseudonocardia cypriaca]